LKSVEGFAFEWQNKQSHSMQVHIHGKIAFKWENVFKLIMPKANYYYTRIAEVYLNISFLCFFNFSGVFKTYN